MILLDTYVISEAMKPAPHPSLRDWLDAQVAETAFLSSASIAELLFGIGALLRGKRKGQIGSCARPAPCLRPDRDRSKGSEARAT